MWDMQYRDKSLNMLAQELSKIEELLDNQIKDSEKGKSIDKIWFLFSLYIGHHSEEDLDQFEFLKDYISIHKFIIIYREIMTDVFQKW